MLVESMHVQPMNMVGTQMQIQQPMHMVGTQMQMQLTAYGNTWF